MTDSRSPSFKNRISSLRNLPEFFRLVWRSSPGKTILVFSLRIIKACLPVLLLYIAKLIIDQVILARGNNTDYEVQHKLWILVAAEFFLVIINDLSSRAINLVDSLLGDLFTNYTSALILKHAATLDVDQFENSEYYDKMERARVQTLGRTMLLTQVMSQIQDLILIIFVVVALITFSSWLIVLMAVSVFPIFWCESYFNNKNYMLARNQTPERRELDYIRYLGASYDTAKEVKMLKLAGYLINKFETLAEKFYSQNRSLYLKRTGWGTFFSLLGSVAYYVAFVVVLTKTIKGAISIGNLTFIAGSFRQLRASMETILTRFTALSQGTIFLQDFIDFFNIKPSMKAALKPVSFPFPIINGFEFENVGFKYPNSDHWAVRNLNFTFPVKEKLALVGENGAGKSTVVKLLMRLYDPTEGAIYLDKVNIKDYDIDQFRSNVGVIFQDFLRFQMTLSDNIGIGNLEELGNDGAIKIAAKKSLADTIAKRFEKGYNQWLGKTFNNGVELSGGEWQKVALARSYMKEGQLIILDEPTASLDAKAEFEIFQRFTNLTKNKTSIIISHRFLIARLADRILVLDRGSLMEMGTHDQLLNANGKYSELFNLQAQAYK